MRTQSVVIPHKVSWPNHLDDSFLVLVSMQEETGSSEVVWDPPVRSGAEFCRRVATPIAARAAQAALCLVCS